MSFRELKEEIYLVLQVRGGHGFGFTSSPLVITANLAGNLHESFIVDACPQPKFESEFVWVMDKTKMKSIWSEKIPVRVECSSVQQSRKNRIGYIILNVKDAQIIHDVSKITEKQIRLLGLSKDIAILKPELILSFYITDIPIQTPQLVPIFHPPLVDGIAKMSEGTPKINLGSGKERFTMFVDVSDVTNLKQLLPSSSDVDPDLLHYKLRIFDADVVTDSSTDYSVRFSLSTSPACLKTYFLRQPLVSVNLLISDLIIGETVINLESLFTEDTNVKKTKNQTKRISCRCFITPCHSNYETHEERPYVDFNIGLTSETPAVKKKSEISLATASSVGAGGDAYRSQCLLLPLQSPVTQPLTPRAAESGGETYRAAHSISSLTFTISVTSLSTRHPLPPHSWIRLRQPCASITPAEAVEVSADNDSWTCLSYQLTVTLPRHLLQTTLSSQPVVLQLGSADTVSASATLCPPENFTLQKHNALTVPLESEGRGEVVGEVGVEWSLYDGSSQSAATLTDTSLSPPTHTHTKSKTAYTQANAENGVLSPRSRELKILSFVEELEDWAEKQRIMVMEGLKEEEEARLAELQSQWESEVGGQVTEGRQLVQALQHMRDQLRQQEATVLDKEHKLKVYKEELDRVHRNKLHEFRELSHRMQDEFNHKLALIANDKVVLEKEVEDLRRENFELKQHLRRVESQGEEDKRLVETLTHDMSLLREKLALEQDSKKFFKEHCRKAEQEIHRLNLLRQQELEERMKSEKKTLEQLVFQQIVTERQDMRQDQRLLDEIRQQLSRRSVDSQLNTSSNENIAFSAEQPFFDERHIRRAT